MSFDTVNNALAVFTDGNGNKWFKAKVITNVDPKNLDRVQVSLPGIYDPNLGDVPWCGPMKMSPFGFGSGYGVFGTPVVGSDVMVTMQDGDVQYPMYMHVQCFPNPTDFPSGTAWGFIDPEGNKLVVAGKDIKFQSGGGFQLHIDASGNFTVTSPDDTTGTWNVPHVTDFTINADADVDITAENFHVVGTTNINDVTIAATTGNVIMPGSLIVTGGATFETLTAFMSGVTIIGTSTSNGHDIGNTHRHTGGTMTGGITGPVTP